MPNEVLRGLTTYVGCMNGLIQKGALTTFRIVSNLVLFI